MPPVIKTDPFAEARQFMADAGAGRVDPAMVRETLNRGEMLRASRRPIKLKMRGDSDKITVRRRSSLYLPAKYEEAKRDKKTITVALYSGGQEIDFEDYERGELKAGKVSFRCVTQDWGLIDGVAIHVGDVGEYHPLPRPRRIRASDKFDLSFPRRAT